MKNAEGYRRDLALLAEHIQTAKPTDGEVHALVHELAADYGLTSDETMAVWDTLPELVEA